MLIIQPTVYLLLHIISSVVVGLQQTLASFGGVTEAVFTSINLALHKKHNLSDTMVAGNTKYVSLPHSVLSQMGKTTIPIRSAMHLPFLLGKQRLVIPACDQKHSTQPTTTACAVMMRSGYNNGGLLRVSRCSVFVMNSLILLEYTDCFLWYLVFVANFGMCYICTVSYRIVLRAYHDTYRSLCIGDTRVCRCIVSALIQTSAIKKLGRSQSCQAYFTIWSIIMPYYI